MAKLNNIIIENGRIIFRNFAGVPSEFNRSNKRTFCTVLPTEEMANNLKADGWNVKTLPARDEQETPTYILQVTVSFKVAPPKIMLITSRNKIQLTEETLAELDTADIETVDMIIRPYNWTVRDASGIAAYLDSMYVTIKEDYFANKYSEPF